MTRCRALGSRRIMPASAMTLPESSLQPPLPYRGLSPPAEPTAWCFLFLPLPASCRQPSRMSDDVTHNLLAVQPSSLWWSLLWLYSRSEDVIFARHIGLGATAFRNAQKRSMSLRLHGMLESAPAKNLVGPTHGRPALGACLIEDHSVFCT